MCVLRAFMRGAASGASSSSARCLFRVVVCGVAMAGLFFPRRRWRRGIAQCWCLIEDLFGLDLVRLVVHVSRCWAAVALSARGTSFQPRYLFVRVEPPLPLDRLPCWVVGGCSQDTRGRPTHLGSRTGIRQSEYRDKITSRAPASLFELSTRCTPAS